MTSYKDYKQRALQDPDFKAEYDKLQEEYDLIQELIDARKQQHLTQKELAMRTVGVDLRKHGMADNQITVTLNWGDNDEK